MVISAAFIHTEHERARHASQCACGDMRVYGSISDPPLLAAALSVEAPEKQSGAAALIFALTAGRRESRCLPAARIETCIGPADGTD